MSYGSVVGHRRMALDRVRNEAYAEALREVVDETTTVLDLGAGTGIHGMMAARMGAKRVYLVEPEDVIAVAEEAVRANGLEHVVRCLQGTIDEVDIPEPVDIIVSAMTGNFLLTEDLLPALLHARDTVLKPGGRLIPDRATMEAVPVSAPALHAREVAAWSEPQCGVTLEPARTYAANSLHYRWEPNDVACLAAPQTIHTIDLAGDAYDPLHAHVSFDVTSAGACHGFAGWFTMRLGSRWVSTAPDADATHWSPAFLPLDPPAMLAVGDSVTLQLDRPPFGEWTWRVSWPGGSQRHSTLLGAPMKASTLRKAAIDYMPALNDEGAAVAFVLARCTGDQRVVDIAQAVRERWPKRYPQRDAAVRFVQSIVKGLA